MNYRSLAYSAALILICLLFPACQPDIKDSPSTHGAQRERLLLDTGWRFYKYGDQETPDELLYDIRPAVNDYQDSQQADTPPTAAADVATPATLEVLKPWILPTANGFILNPRDHHQKPAGNPGGQFQFVQKDFDDSRWQAVTVPHDWAIGEPFYQGWNVPVGGGMGRLPSPGVAWYRNKIQLSEADKGKTIFLDIEGAMSYSMVWCNGQLVGGWPYGYASYRLNLTPYIEFGESNQIAIRLDNPPDSSRWYPGGGLYRDIWLVKTQPLHIAQWGTRVATPEVSKQGAEIAIEITVENLSPSATEFTALTEIYTAQPPVKKVAELTSELTSAAANGTATVTLNTTIDKPLLWGPPPDQSPNLYVAKTTVMQQGKPVDEYQTRFGIRQLSFDGTKGIFVNGEPVYIRGVNQHHDLGALGAAFNRRAAQRQLEILREMGVNAIRVAHNPPATGLLELADEMGFLVVDEIFDVWERKKAPLDFHLIFKDWSEPDLRAFIRRDRNHPSVIMWSLGNEVGEQYTDLAGAAIAERLHTIAKQEDPTRLTTISVNYAKPHMPISGVMDVINLNYQGEGIRNAPAYSHLKGIRTSPLYPAFHKQFPDKVILSSENAAAVSSRGEYLFPVHSGVSAPVEDGQGGDPVTAHVSAYDLYTAQFGSSADKVMATQKAHPYVAGGFVWSGWDYIGEPTPYYSARSSYFGVIDLAGFKKNRFYLYQSNWRPTLPMVHIFPHWNWPGREGKTTPVHIVTTGDEVELFVNGTSQGRKAKGEGDSRLRWDKVTYYPGSLTAVAYKNKKKWAEKTIKTTGVAKKLLLEADRHRIINDGRDLSFITVKVADENDLWVPNAKNAIQFSITGPGEIVATDNGDPTDMTPFSSINRNLFNGLALVIVKVLPKGKGTITITATGKELERSSIKITPITGD